MRTAVVTAYRAGGIGLERLCESVAKQTHPCTHILVSDGLPDHDLVRRFGAEHIEMADFHDDYGTTCRSIGAMSAWNRGFDAVAYLDAPHWYEVEHIASCIHAVQRVGSIVAFCERRIVLPDGAEIVGGDPADAERNTVNSNRHFVTAAAASFSMDWAMIDRSMAGQASDAVYAIMAHFGTFAAWTGRASLNFVGDTPHYFALAGRDPADAGLDPLDDPRRATFETARNHQRTRLSMNFV